MVKSPPVNAGDARDAGSILGSGRSPGVGNGNLPPVFLLGKFHGQRSLVGYGPWSHKDTAQSLSIPPLQAYSPSCLLIPWLASMLLDIILMWIIITPEITYKSICYVPHAFLATYINSYFSWQSSNIGIWRLREFTYLVHTVQLILIGD